MLTSPLRRAAAAAVTAGSLAFFSAPADAQQCYPPTPGCATTIATTPPRQVVSTVPFRPPSQRGGLARTGAVVVPTALVGVGLVAAGVILKRSSGRDKASSKPA